MNIEREKQYFLRGQAFEQSSFRYDFRI